MKIRNHRRFALILALGIAVLAPFFLLSSPLEPWGVRANAGRVLQEIIYPFEWSWVKLSASVRTSWHQYVDLRKAAKQNESLKRELAENKTRTIDYDEQVLEITRLRKLLGFAQHYENQLIVGEVMGSPMMAPFYAVRISHGDLDGVKVGMPVVTAEGIVGKVMRTGFKHADVQILTDANFNVDVLLQRSRVRGVLRGMNGLQCLLKLHRNAEIRIGDTLITSGIVGGFPKGLPVGHVVKISYESDNVSQIITVEPWVDYQRIEEVFVLQQKDRELQKIVDAAGKEWLEKTVKQAGEG